MFLNSGVFASYFLDVCVAPPGVRLPQHVRLGWKCLVCVQGDPLALPQILLPARTRKAAGPGTHLIQPPNIVADAEICTKKVQTEATHPFRAIACAGHSYTRKKLMWIKEQHLTWST